MRFSIIFIFLSQLTFAQYEYVNPFIGTGGHGHTFPGVTVPFGMVQLSPDTRIDGSWDGCGGYHYSDSFIYGFSHTHLSGTGVSDYGDILLLPSVNPISFEPEKYKTKFSHSDEKAEANYYSVGLRENGVKVELSASTWAGFHRYSFNKNEGYVLLDLKHRDKTVDFLIQPRGNHSIDGFRISNGWANEQHCYFSMDFTEEIATILYNNDSSKALLKFENLENNQLEAYVGLSFTSIAGAQQNLTYETTKTYDWVQFDEIVNNGQIRWNKELSKIEVFTEDEDKKYNFYTALYHCMIHPNIAEDVDGKYRGHDMKIHDSPNHTQYTVFSLWDTYRALHPLMAIIDEKRTTDFINSFLEIYKESGRLPIWELASNETDCMIGYHAVSVIADAYLKGIRGFDTTLALEAMVASANKDLFGLPSYRKYGFIRVEDEAESVSKTLEYTYDDWCISQMSRAMGQGSITNIFSRRAESWRNIINPKTGFATPRLNGDWLPNFDPREVNNHFTEANSWQYSFVQHAQGGREEGRELEGKLDAFFSEAKKTTGRTQSDITGLIGQYAHGNEPSHHIAYLYNYTPHPEKGKKIIKQICDSFYTNTPDGLIGNEDCGQMSAWYVFSSLGFYPASPGSDVYLVGTSSFDSAKINTEYGRVFKLKVFDVEGQPFINGAISHFFRHPTFNSNSSLTFSRSGSSSFSIPIYLAMPNFSEEFSFVSTPLIKGKSIFEEETLVALEPLKKNHGIEYWLNDDRKNTKVYDSSFVITNTTSIHARSFDKEPIYYVDDGEHVYNYSPIISATFFKKPNNWSCTPSIAPNPQYDGGGEDALVDGIRGEENWKAGRWQGYQHGEVSFDLDFKEVKTVAKLQASFLQDARSWILMPSRVEIYCDGELVGEASYELDAFIEENFLETISVQLNKKIKTDKIQIKIYSAGKLPKGHQGYSMGGDSFFFVDELSFF